MSAKTVRTAVVGAGFVGRVHAETIRRLGFVDIAAIVDTNLTQARKYAEEFRVAVATSDYAAVLGERSIDAVHICTPNFLHAPMAQAALEAGKHVICEKPLALSTEQAAELAALAKVRNLRNCTCHNLRYYPLVQHMLRMREDGDLGEIFLVQGTYSQDWLLYDTDYNWRIDAKENGPSRCLADIGSHFCDMAEHVTGHRISEVCADLRTLHKTRRRPKGPVETFAGNMPTADDHISHAVDTEDLGTVIFRMDNDARGAYTASQVSAGCKNRLRIEIFGTKSGVAWDQERPDELWIGNRNTNNQILIKDPSLLKANARPYADLPGGHGEGYEDTFKQLFRRFYGSILDPAAKPEYPQFADGLRQLKIIEAEVASNRSRSWVAVPE